MKHPENQRQHKLPEVYLKQFGYLFKDHWKVSVIQRNEKFIRQKSIGSFTAETNVFDIDDTGFHRIFELLNADLENLFHEMLEDIKRNEIIPDKCWEILVQLAPNFMARSDYWRNHVRELVNSPYKQAFLDITISFDTDSYDDLIKLRETDFYKKLYDGGLNHSKLNKVLLLFLNYLFHHLKSFDVIILEAPENRGFFTSDIPVHINVNQEAGKFGLFSKDTDIYFPLSPRYLAYFFSSSSKRKSKLRSLKNRGVYRSASLLNEDEFDTLVKTQIISPFWSFLITPGKIE